MGKTGESAAGPRFGRAFLGAYIEADFLTRAKARYTLYLALVLLAADILPFGLMIAGGFKPFEAAFRLASALIVLAALAILRSGRARIASAFLVVVTVVVLWAFMYMRPFQHYYELYSMAFLLETSVLMACVVGYGPALPAVAAGLAYAGVLALFAARTRASSPPELLGKELESLFFIAMFFAISGFLGDSLMRLTASFTSMLSRELERGRGRIEALGGALGSVGEGRAVGDRLLAIARDDGERARESARGLSALKGDFARLEERMRAAAAGNAEIAGLVERVRDLSLRHSEAVQETGAAIEQINATIDSAGAGNSDRRARLAALRGLTAKGSADMGSALGAIKNISDSSATIKEVGRIIQRISSQTNLLAMNASIEAAHAGDYGRGFSVVADEIRALAEQAGANAKEITRTLAAISSEIEQARALNQKASEGFSSIESEVGSVSDAMSGVFNALDEVRDGISEIAKASVGVREASLEIETAMKSMAERSGEGRAELDGLGSSLGGYSASVQRVLDAFAAIVADMGELEAVGKENLSRIGDIEAAIARVDGASAATDRRLHKNAADS